MKNNRLMFAILYFAAVVTALSMIKLTGIMPEVEAHLGITPAQAGLLVSIFTIAGVVMVIPGASLMA